MSQMPFASVHPELFAKLVNFGSITMRDLQLEIAGERNLQHTLNEVIQELLEEGVEINEDPDDFVLTGAPTTSPIIENVETGGNTDTQRAYMRDVGNYELLSREEEISLGRQIYEGNQEIMAAFSNFPQLVNWLLENFDDHYRRDNLDHFLDNFTDPVTVIPKVVQKKRSDSEHRKGRKKKLHSPEQAQARREAVESAFKHYQTLLAEGAKSHLKPMRSARAELEQELKFFLLTDRYQQQLIAQFNEIVDPVLALIEDIRKQCVSLGVPHDRYVEKVKGQEHAPKWLRALLKTKEPYCEKMRNRQTGLRKKQEELAARIEASQLDAKTLMRVIDRRRNGAAMINNARDRLILGNLRLVMSIARKYSAQGVPVMDLIQEGNMGMVKGIEKYDYRLGFKFSTYATWWIRQAISRTSHSKNRTIRLPSNVENLIRKIAKNVDQLQQELGRPPTDAELVGRIDEDVDKIRQALDVGRDLVSTNQSVGKDDETTIEENLHVLEQVTPDDELHQTRLRQMVQNVLGNLNGRDAKAIMMMFGIDGGPEMSKAEIAKQLNIGTDQVTRIVDQAMKKLRSPRHMDILRPFLA